MTPPINFNTNKCGADSFYDNIFQEAVEMYGVEVVYYPIWEYDTENDDVILGEDDVPRYGAGVSLKAYYNVPEDKKAVFEKLGMYVEEELELVIPISLFNERIPAPVKDSDYVGPKEGDWIETLSGEIRMYSVVNVQEGDWYFGRPHSWKLTLKPRKYTHEQVEGDYETPFTTETSSSSASGDSVLGVPDEQDDSDEIDEQETQVDKEEDDNLWGPFDL